MTSVSKVKAGQEQNPERMNWPVKAPSWEIFESIASPMLLVSRKTVASCCSGEPKFTVTLLQGCPNDSSVGSER